MLINKRAKPHELIFHEALSARCELLEDERIKFNAVRRGYEGELLYDTILEDVGHETIYVYRDVYLKIENSITQYDSLIINDDGIVVNEIKNFNGQCRIENEHWYNGNFLIPDDPFSQLNRAVGKLTRISNSSRGGFNTSGKLIFPNDNFTLNTDNQSAWNKIILRSGLRRYFNGFKNGNVGRRADYIVKLISNLVVENPYFKTDIDFNRLKLGLYCGKCGSFNLSKTRFHLTCADCFSTESNETHLLRALSDYKFLFYNQPMTRNSFLKFIDYMIPVKSVSRMLNKHCYVDKKSNMTEYRFKYYDFAEAITSDDVYKRYKDNIK